MLTSFTTIWDINELTYFSKRTCMSFVENIYYFTISLLSVMRDWVNQSGTCIEYQTLETKLETVFNFVYFNQLIEFVHSSSFFI